MFVHLYDSNKHFVSPSPSAYVMHIIFFYAVSPSEVFEWSMLDL